MRRFQVAPARTIRRTLAALVAALCAAGDAGPAFAWGQYGHQAIHEAAVDLLKAHGDAIAVLFSAKEDMVKRLSSTPDIDWKMIGKTDQLSKEEYAAKKYADSLEHPLHYFEADTYLDPKRGVDSLADLPTGEYQDVLKTLDARLHGNAKAVQAMDPSKPLDVASHGTAPWRILQLYDLGVEALKAGDDKKAILYLGAMGHYVGDMSQPFHTTMDFDGDLDSPPSAGIHSTFEEKILEEAGELDGEGKAKRDPESMLWDLRHTHAKVTKAAERSHDQHGHLTRELIVPAILDLVRSGYPMIQPLLKAFADQCALAQKGQIKGERFETASVPGQPFCVAVHVQGERHPRTRVNDAITDGFADAKLDNGQTVLEYAEERLGMAAALLHRIWQSAYEAAGSPKLDPLRVSFDALDAIGNYPAPGYLQPVGRETADPARPPRRIRRRTPQVPEDLNP